MRIEKRGVATAGLASLALQHAQGGPDQLAEARNAGFDPASGTGDPSRTVVQLGEPTLRGAEFRVLADQQIAQPEDLLFLASELRAELGLALRCGGNAFRRCLLGHPGAV